MKTTESRLFFGFWPDQQVRNRLRGLAEDLSPDGGRVQHPEDLHITLIFLGSVDDDQRPCIEAAAASVSSPSFELTLDHIDYWRRPRILCCGASETPEVLARLVADLQTAMRDCGFKSEKRPYRPHVTLVRKARSGTTYALDPPLRWPVREFALVASHQVAKPPRYQVLKTWILGS